MLSNFFFFFFTRRSLVLIAFEQETFLERKLAMQLQALRARAGVLVLRLVQMRRHHCLHHFKSFIISNTEVQRSNPGPNLNLSLSNCERNLIKIARDVHLPPRDITDPQGVEEPSVCSRKRAQPAYATSLLRDLCKCFSQM